MTRRHVGSAKAFCCTMDRLRSPREVKTSILASGMRSRKPGHVTQARWSIKHTMRKKLSNFILISFNNLLLKIFNGPSCAFVLAQQGCF